MPADEMLQYFTNLSMNMDGKRVLRRARQLLLKFRQLPGIPCTVRGLLSGTGVWDSAPLPEVECNCHGNCCYRKSSLESADCEVTNGDQTGKCEESIVGDSVGEKEKYEDERSEKRDNTDDGDNSKDDPSLEIRCTNEKLDTEHRGKSSEEQHAAEDAGSATCTDGVLSGEIAETNEGLNHTDNEEKAISNVGETSEGIPEIKSDA